MNDDYIIPPDKISEPDNISETNHTNDVTKQSMLDCVNERHAAIYRETIRNESMRHKRTFLKQGFAFVCIVSIIGGMALGVGLSFGALYINKFSYVIFGDKVVTRKTSSKIEQVFSPFESIQSRTASTRNTEGYSQIVSEIEPSVVCITATVLNNLSMFNYTMEPLGSGIIFFSDNEKVYIVTNNHVVSGAVSVSISVTGSEGVPAKLIGKQTEADLAVVSVSWDDLEAVGIYEVKTAKFGDSANMRVGDIVLAIGNALGEGNTATQGIVSAVNKKINIDDRDLSVIQTDAAINPGNSGGPLVNMNGEVIGINTAKLLKTSVEGTGYSITSSAIVPVIQELLNTKLEFGPFLGIQGDDISGQSTEISGSQKYGVYIVSVIKGSAAEKYGLKRSDIIVGFNNEDIQTMKQLSEMIKQCNIGEEVKIDIIRDTKTKMTLNVVLSDDSGSSF